ncbi:MAG: hypothetical protein KAJ20_01915 [Candidatus Aenigmarchaeota archaeon]|nr:hypothetical protein [Candidatus Aenigmarchaeota archaeon]MCK5062991.1 hypothetical protein [Candidatus Aenigmarchaeota archaeon]MCK5289550.1 hypothetical protein [Candidatus Aenigmarchaeota archaeon]MCK5373067.1 hypothetical protein [Candidatus Aenigmarchaeota archaeon]
MVQKNTRKGLLLPIFFEKIMLIGLAVGVIFWIIYSSINTEEVSVIMRQERNDIEIWNQVLKSDIFRAGSDTVSGSGKTDYLMYFDGQKIQDAYDQTKTGAYGDISCKDSNPVAKCIHFYPIRYYLKVEVGANSWSFTNGDAVDFPVSDSDFKYAEAVGVLEAPKENPSIGKIMFQADFYD